MTFHKSTRIDKNAYCETAIVCLKIYNYKIHVIFFFAFVHSDVNKPNPSPTLMDSRAEWVKEKLYPLVSRKSDDSSQPINVLQWVLAPPFWYPLLC